MKYLTLVLATFVAFGTCFQAHANSDYDWSQTQIDAVYEEAEDILIIYGSVPYSDDALERYSLGVNIAGESYRKFFTYDEYLKRMIVRFDIPEATLRAEYPYSLSIKDKLFYEIYTDSGTVVFSGVNQPSSYTPTQNTKNNGSSSYSRTPTATQIKYRESFFDGKISRVQYEIWKKNKQSSASSSNVGKNNNPYYVDFTKYTPKTPNRTQKRYGTFIPRYKTPSDEPRVINGIGNNPRYNSWRVGK